MSLLIQSSLFSRRENFSHAHFSASQIQIDACVEAFSNQATDVASLSAMIGGQFAFRFTRLALSAASSSFLTGTSAALSLLSRSASFGSAFAAETFAFTGIQRAFHPSENNFSSDFLHSSLSLASLKIFAGWSGQQNPLFQHFATDLAMVGSHQLASLAGMEEKSRVSLIGQLFEAEAMNWQMKIGMRLFHTLLPSIASVERNLNISSQLLHNITRTRPSDFTSDLKTLSFSAMQGRSDATRRVHPYFTAGIINRVTRTEMPESPANDPKLSALRAQLLSQLPASLRTIIEKKGPRLGFVFLPGMYNPPPDPAWMSLISAAFGRGGLVISTAPGRDRIMRQGLYTMLGENTRVLQDYEREVPMVFRRLALALRDPAILGGIEELVLLGHSKGGLLCHGLKAIHQAYVANGSRIPDFIHKLYPGLSDISPPDIQLVMSVLGRSFFSALDWPIEGISYTLPVRAVDRLLLEGIAEGFETERVDRYIHATRLHPDEMDLVMHSQMPGLVDSLMSRTHPGNGIESLAYKTTGVFFYGVSFVMGARDGDGLLRRPQRYRSQGLRGRYNHLDVIVRPHAAAEILDLTFSHYARRQELHNPPIPRHQ